MAPPVNLLISTLYFFEGVCMLWNPGFWLSIALVDGSQIQFDDTLKMLCTFQAGMMLALAAAFCTLDGRKRQTTAIVSGNFLLLLLCYRVHTKIMQFTPLGLFILAFYGVLMVLSYMSADGTLGFQCCKVDKGKQKKRA